MALPPVSDLFQPSTCFPAWHTTYKKYGGRLLGVVRSGCSTVNGNVQCKPEDMVAHAAQVTGLPVSLEVYTLARYFASEIGSGTVEEKIAVAQAAINRATYVERLPHGIVDLLLYRQAPGNPHRGYYGPIHGPSGVTTAPYGRWAATSRDPTYGDIVLAIALLGGVFDGFNKGADDQAGMQYQKAFPDPAATIRRMAEHHDYWVGPLPGVDHWKTFLYRHVPEIAPSSAEGQYLIARAMQAVADRNKHPSWALTPICGNSKMSTVLPAFGAFTGMALVSLLGIGLASRKLQLLGGRSDDWWKRHQNQRHRLCYRTKTAALQVFRDANRDTIERWGGLDVKASPAEFDALNQKYDLRGRRAVRDLSRALWQAMPSKPPFCLDRIDLTTLNRTSPGQHGRGFVLPSWAYEAAGAREDVAHEAKLREEYAQRAVDKAFDRALAKRGVPIPDVPF